MEMPFKKGEKPDGSNQFEKGQTGNPNGRPKGTRNRSTIARYWLDAVTKKENPLTGKLEELSQADQIMLALLKKALRGDIAAAKELLDSGFGANKQIVENTHEVTTKDIIAKAFPDAEDIPDEDKSEPEAPDKE